jgi:hypothetical protein
VLQSFARIGHASPGATIFWAGFAVVMTAFCFLMVLSHRSIDTPGVAEPKLGYDGSADGSWPFLEFRSEDGSRWKGITTRFTFEALKHGRSIVLVQFVGQMTLDGHLRSAIFNQWRDLCGTDVDIHID